MRTLAALAVALCLLPLLANAAQAFEPVKDRADFLRLIEGRELRLGLFNITLSLTPDGRITGTALGWAVTGEWTWQDGFFCRKIDWSGTIIPANCQLVEARGNEQVRFTIDRGAGDAATFRLR